MKLDEATVTGTLTHVCGQQLAYVLTVSGNAANAHMRGPRFVLESFFARTILTWKAHGTRIKKCPTCGKGLPISIEEVDDSEFLHEFFQVAVTRDGIENEEVS